MVSRLDKKLILLWLISPTLSLWYAIKNIRKTNSIIVFSLFSFFFGLSFVIAEDVPGAADSARYARELKKLNNQPLGFDELAGYLYNKETGNVDLYEPTITWIFSNFTSNPKWLFGFFGLIFGYFWFKNIRIIINLCPKKINLSLLLLLFLFALNNPIWQINGVRMWTAAQIFTYAVFLVYLKNKSRGYIIAVSSIFVHFSFVFPSALLIGYSFLPKKTTLFFIVYLSTFLIHELDPKLIQEYFRLLPDFLQSRSSYINDTVVENYRNARATGTDKAWHFQLAVQIKKYFLTFTTIIIFIETQFIRKKMDQVFIQIFALALFFSAFANLTSLFPSGGRFQIVSASFLLAAAVLFYRQTPRSYFNTFLKISTPLLVFYLIFAIRVGFDFIGTITVFGNPLFAIFFEDEVPLIDFMKSIF